MPIVFREVTQASVSDGAEQALFGWWLFCPDTSDPNAMVGALTDVTLASYWWDNSGATELRTRYDAHVALAQRWIEVFDEDSGAIIQRLFLDLPVNTAGASSQGQLPAEVSPCMGVRSGFADKHGNGRFYLPPPDVDSLGPVGDFTAAFQDLAVNSFGNYFDALNAHSIVVGTWSQAVQAFTPAQTINMGDIPDSQRRRRNKLVEARRNRAVN